MLARVVVYPLSRRKTFGEVGGAAFCILFSEIIYEILFGHGGGVFFHRLTWFSRFFAVNQSQG